MALLTHSALDRIERTHGIISHDELLRLGTTRFAVRRMVRDGLLELVLPGAYRLRGVEFDELGRCAAVCIAHPESVIAGPTAGRLWGFRRLPIDSRVHTLSPPHSHPTIRRWVKVYRTAAIHPTDIVARPDAIRLTTRARTAFDLARFVDDRALLSIIEQAMHEGGHTLVEMREVAVDWLSPRRRWATRFVRQLDRLLPGGPAESGVECDLGQVLVDAGLRGLVRQHDVELPGHGAARFDLAIPELRWAIEVDVFPTHRESEGRDRDRRRDAGADAIDWTTTRVGPEQLGAALPATVGRLLDTARERRVALAHDQHSSGEV